MKPATLIVFAAVSLFAVGSAAVHIVMATAGDSVVDRGVEDARELAIFTVAKAAHPNGGTACHSAVATEIEGILAGMDEAARDDAVWPIAWWAARDGPVDDHFEVELAVHVWLRGDPAVPAECAAGQETGTTAADGTNPARGASG